MWLVYDPTRMSFPFALDAAHAKGLKWGGYAT